MLTAFVTFVACAFSLLAKDSVPPTTATFSVSVANVDDQAANYIVGLENARRAALNPPGDALPLTPLASLQSSYEAVLEQMLEGAHMNHVAQAARVALDNGWLRSTSAQRAAALAALEPAP